MKSILILMLSLFIINSNVLADSPLTSTPFHMAYSHIDAVKYAEKNGLDKKTLKFLDSNAPSDQKLAVVNALSWGDTSNIKIFESYLLKKRKGLKAEVFEYLSTVQEEAPVETDLTKKLSSDDLMLWSYIKAMGDYFNPNKAIRGAYFAYLRAENNMAYATAFSLIGSQVAFDYNWCNVYLICHDYIETLEYTDCKLVPKAVSIIMEYINLYKESCEGTE